MGVAKPVAIATLLTAARAEPRARRHVDILGVYREFERLMIDHYAHDPAVCAVPDACETFETLKRHGVRVALDSGFNRAIVDVILQRLGWGTSGLIDASVASDEVTRGRPAPDLIARAMALTGVDDPQAVAKVGDTPADLQEGTAAACALVIGITTGSHTRQELLGSPHTHLIERLAEVPPLCVR
jgi:phosphonatase-like hydrolase